MKKLFSTIKMFKQLQTEEFEAIFESKLDNILDATNNSEKEAQIVAQDYFKILKSKLPNIKVKDVVIDGEEPYLITVNGKLYQIDDIIKHNDLKNTEFLMEIQSLWDNVDKKKVQSILNEMISGQR